ncbi:MAG: RNA polymerase sigma factor [Bacteroidota bacterium]
MPLNDEKLLIQQAQGGDISAFEQLVYRYDKQVLSIAAGYVRTAEDAKDIYQEVLLKVYRGLPKFKGLSEFSTWLYRVTTNVCLTHKAKKKKHHHASIDEETDGDDGETHSMSQSIMDESASADQQMLDAEISNSIHQALESLSPQQKMVFTLRYYQGYKLREIASMMDCAEGTVKKYLFTATQRMREQLKDLY